MKKIKKILKSSGRFIMAIVAVLSLPFFSGCGTTAPSGYAVNLEVWGTFDESLTYSEIINQYKQLNPHVGEIKYRKFSQDTYKQELVDALASGQGPDIFLINNGWLPYFENKIEPAPTPLVSEQDIKNNFPDVVAADFVSDGKTFAVPLSVDSMQLFYNRDMFNAAGITAPPKTWFEFQADVQKLTRLNMNGSFDLSGAAIGTGINVNRAADLLSLLMLQNGVDLPSKKGMQIKLDEGVIGKDGNVTQAGESALGFYTQFSRLNTASNTRNPFYTWNSRSHNSVDAFSEGSAAMMFNYSWKMAEIREKNPKLNFAVASVPQAYPEKPATYANYWGYAVAKNKLIPTSTVGGQVSASSVTNEMRTHEAWQFLRFLTLKNSGTITLYNAITKNSMDFPVNFDPALNYLKKTQQPAARRDIIESQKTDINLGSFAAGNLIAKHWYQVDPDAVDKIFVDMIESVNRGDISLHEALVLARNRLSYAAGGSSLR